MPRTTAERPRAEQPAPSGEAEDAVSLSDVPDNAGRREASDADMEEQSPARGRCAVPARKVIDDAGREARLPAPSSNRISKLCGRCTRPIPAATRPQLTMIRAIQARSDARDQVAGNRAGHT